MPRPIDADELVQMPWVLPRLLVMTDIMLFTHILAANAANIRKNINQTTALTAARRWTEGRNDVYSTFAQTLRSTRTDKAPENPLQF